MRKNLISVSLFLLTATGAYAASTTAQDASPYANDPRYFQIRSVTTQRVDAPPSADDLSLTADLALPAAPATPPASGTATGIIGAIGTAAGGLEGDIGDIIGIGKQIWDIVVANQPVMNITTNTYSALPQGRSADDLDSWSLPKTAKYETLYTNLFGMNVVTLDYDVTFQYGGTLKGIGHYVANATMVPTNVQVSWGYTLNAQAQSLSPTNIGTKASPVALVQMGLQWTVSTVLKKQQNTVNYYLDGNGRVAQE